MKEYDDKYYQDFNPDPSAVKRGMPAQMKAQQERNRAKKQAIDDEIITWVSQQPKQVKQHINDILRQEMLFIQQQQTVVQ